MTATVVCTACKQPTTFSRLPVAACVHCGRPFDADVAKAAESALRGERPFLITLVTWGSWLMAIPMVFMMLSLVPGCPGEFSINDEPVTQEEWTARVGPFILPLGVLLLVLAVGLTKRKAWTRHVVVGLFLVPFASLLFPASRGLFGVGTILLSIVPLAVPLWYFYAKPNVVQYYRELRVNQANTPMQADLPSAGR